MRILTGELRLSPNYSRKYSPGGKRNSHTVVLLLSKGCFLVVVESSARRPPSRGRRTGPSPTSRDTTPTSRDDRTSRASSRFQLQGGGGTGDCFPAGPGQRRRAGTTGRRRAGTTGRRRAGTTTRRAGTTTTSRDIPLLVEPGRNTTVEPGL